MDIKYVNHLNEELDLSGFPYLLQDSGAFDFSWEYDMTEKTKMSIIDHFRRTSKKFPADIVIHDKNFDDALNRFFEVTERDVIDEIPGKLLLRNKSYLTCYIVESKHSSIRLKNKWNIREVNIVSPHPFWIRELKRTFRASGAAGVTDEDLGYPHDYAYDYTPAGGASTWATGHYAPSHFEMIVYGPVVDPQIIINGHTYIFYDSVDRTDYVLINSRENKIVKYRANGTQADLWDFRGKEDSIFDPIPGGTITLNWSGSFGFDLTLFCERSEPEW